LFASNRSGQKDLVSGLESRKTIQAFHVPFTLPIPHTFVSKGVRISPGIRVGLKIKVTVFTRCTPVIEGIARSFILIVWDSIAARLRKTHQREF
jgi:hypothetical protein